MNAFADVQRQIGNFYFYANYFEKAMEYYLLSSKLCEKIGYEAGKAACVDNIANLLNAKNQLVFNESDYHESIKYHKEALSIYQRINDTLYIPNSLNNLGDTYMTGKDFDSANICFLDAYKRYLSLNSEGGLILSLLNLGEINFNLAVSNYLV